MTWEQVWDCIWKWRGLCEGRAVGDRTSLAHALCHHGGLASGSQKWTLPTTAKSMETMSPNNHFLLWISFPRYFSQWQNMTNTEAENNTEYRVRKGKWVDVMNIASWWYWWSPWASQTYSPLYGWAFQLWNITFKTRQPGFLCCYIQWMPLLIIQHN